jgi:hypothetical protein
MGSMVFLISVCPYVERPGAQWSEGPACLLCCHNDDQPILNHLHWSSKWVSLSQSTFTMHACLQPKIICSLSQSDTYTFFKTETDCLLFSEKACYFNLLCFGSFLECICHHDIIKLQRRALHNRELEIGFLFILDDSVCPFPTQRKKSGSKEVNSATVCPLPLSVVSLSRAI